MLNVILQWIVASRIRIKFGFGHARSLEVLHVESPNPARSSALSRSTRAGGEKGTLMPTTARNMSGRIIAAFHATGAPQSWPR